MSATTALSRPVAALVGLVGILSTGCASMVEVGPRPPGGAATTTSSPVTVDDSPFSVDERARIVAVDPWIEQAATKHRLDPDLLRGLVWVESRFDPRAQSPAGARGLMQLMPTTAAGLAPRVGPGRANAYDPQFNVLAGTLYLSDMLARYRGDVVLALAAYNAGPGNVDRWIEEDGELPPRSREFADLVLAAKQRFEKRWRVPDERTNTQLAAAPTPVRAPAPVVIPEPPVAEEPDPPLRWDLDTIDRTDAPTLADGEPEHDVPAPAFTTDADETRAPAKTDDEPTIGLGVLPSVGD